MLYYYCSKCSSFLSSVVFFLTNIYTISVAKISSKFSANVSDLPFHGKIIALLKLMLGTTRYIFCLRRRNMDEKNYVN